MAEPCTPNRRAKGIDLRFGGWHFLIMMLRELRRHPVSRYGFAVLSVAVCTALKLGLEHNYGPSRPFFFMRMAVLLTAFWMGLGPALIALIASALSVAYFFLPPYYSLQLSVDSLYSEFLYVTETTILIGIIIVLRRALDEASRRTLQLQQTEQRLNVALTGTSISVSNFDRDLRCVWVYNLPGGFVQADVLGKRMSEIAPGESADELEIAEQQVLDSGVPARLELAFPLGDDLHTFDIVIEPQRYGLGDVEGITIAASDITDRKRYESVLREEEAKFRQLADSMPQIVWAARPDGYIDYWNKRWLEFTGFPEGEYGDDSWLPALHPDDVQPALNAWYHSVKSGEALQAEMRMRDLHAGEFRWFLNRAVPVRDSFGTITRWFGSMTDMHDYRAAMDAVSKSEERFRSLVTAISQIVWRTNAEGRVESEIQGWEELTGQPIEDSIGFGWVSVVHPGDRERALEAWTDAVRTGALFNTDYRLRMKDESYRWFSARGVPVRDAYGTVREWVGLCADIESRRRAQEQMELAAEAMEIARDAAVQANRAKSAFLANISHELRTPLNAILGYAEILQEDLRPLNREQMLGDAERIITAGSHLLGVVNDVLDISKIEAGRMNFVVRKVAISEVLHEVQSTIAPLAERNRNTLTIDSNGAGTLDTDPDKLRQILVNLLSNACKFTENGEVSLYCSRQEDDGRTWVTFEVTDTGIGIADEDLPRLFHDFSQIDASLTRRYGGTGLGLAICQRFASLMGGDILVDSEPGKGSRFTLRLPTEAGV